MDFPEWPVVSDVRSRFEPVTLCLYWERSPDPPLPNVIETLSLRDAAQNATIWGLCRSKQAYLGDVVTECSFVEFFAS